MNDLPKEIMEGVNELIQTFREIDYTDIKEDIRQFRKKWIEPNIRWEANLRHCYAYESVAVNYTVEVLKCFRSKELKSKTTYGAASDDTINKMLLTSYKESKYADFPKIYFRDGFDYYANSVYATFSNNVIRFQKKGYEPANKISIGYMFFNYILQRESKDDTIRKRDPYDDKVPLLKSIDLLSVANIQPISISLEDKYQKQLIKRAQEIQKKGGKEITPQTKWVYDIEEIDDNGKTYPEHVLRQEIDSLILLVSKAWNNKEKLGKAYELHRRWSLIMSILNNAKDNSIAVFLIYALAIESEHLVQWYKEKYLISCEEDDACLYLIRKGYLFTAINIMKERPQMSLEEFFEILKKNPIVHSNSVDKDNSDGAGESELVNPYEMKIISDMFDAYSFEFYKQEGIKLFTKYFMPEWYTAAVLYGKREMNNMVANLLALDHLITEYEDTHSKLVHELQSNLQYLL